jgi:DNA polymerase V
VIVRWASHLVRRMYKPAYAYKKAGVVLSDISPVTQWQHDWLEPSVDTASSLADNPSSRLMQAIDGLNQRFGKGAVKISTQGAFAQWQMKQERKSPNYTTDWHALPRA